MSTVIPAAKIGDGGYFPIYSYGAINYFQISGITAISNKGGVTESPTLSPLDAYSIDSKMDDGLPATGIVRGMNSYANFATPGANSCESNAPGNPYNTIAPNATLHICEISFLFRP